MVDFCPAPGSRGVTGHAVGTGRNVNGWLAAGLSSVVTAGTVGSRIETAVIHLGASPSRGAVTAHAVGRGRHMVGRFAAGLCVCGRV